MKRFTKLTIAAASVSLLLGFAACGRIALYRGLSPHSAVSARPAPVALEAPRLTAPATGTCRILLDADTLQRLRRSARERTPAFVRAQARADEALGKQLASGYQGFEWADALANLSLMWHATSDARYAEGAVRYLQALLDDRLVPGDRQGGASVVSHDSGYGMRTFGAYTALGYDWLHAAPGMNDGLRRRALERLGQWIDWYQHEGYLRDRATSNYYWGYLTTLSFAGLAAASESPAAATWLSQARDELSKRVLPELRDRLAGGGWPEGAQYGEYTTLEIALVARAFRSGAGVDVAGKLPWLAESVTQHVHALLPDGTSVYDGGTWGEHPARASGLGMAALSFALRGVDDQRASEARWMSAHALPPLEREQVWVGLLADPLGAAERAPREPGKTSLHLAGLGLTFARSDWSSQAVWASFQAGPPLAEDHQDADQGHFELFRGSDALLVDGGGSEGSATINHNTLLIDDGGENLNYPPNQGVWGAAVKTTRFGDDGRVVSAVGQLGEAYAPKCASEGCTRRSVHRLTRSWVYVRPALLVINDELELDDSDYDATWAAHVLVNPSLKGNLASAVVGKSRLDIRTLLPEAASPRALREPTPSGEGPHRANQPWGPMWRIEVPSPRGKEQRSFLHFISAGPAQADPSDARPLLGRGLHGGWVNVADRSVAVLFTDEKAAGELELPRALDEVIVAGLAPGRRYALKVEACHVRLAPVERGTDPIAGPGGTLRSSGADCDRK